MNTTLWMHVIQLYSTNKICSGYVIRLDLKNVLPEAVAPVDGIVLKQLFLITDLCLSLHLSLLSMQFNHLVCNRGAY